MGRWSRLFWCCGFVASLGCATPTLHNGLINTPHSTERTIPEVSAQPSFGTTGSGKMKDPDLPPEKAAKLCMATGEELEKSGHLEQAAAEYELALQHQPKLPGAGKKLAACYARAHKYDEAIAQYKKDLAVSPRDPDILNDLGYTYYEKEDFATAEKYLRQAIAVKPGHQRANGNLGLALGRQCKWKESLEAFKKAGTPASAQANLAAMYLAAGQYDDARRSCNIALGLDPELKTARELLAKLDELAKEDDKVIKQAEAKLSKEPAVGRESAASRVVDDTPADPSGVKLQKPIRVNRQTEPQEFRPVK